MALCRRTGLDITMALGASAGLSCHAVSHCHHATPPLLFLSHLFTAYLLTIQVPPTASACLLSCVAWLQAGLVTSPWEPRGACKVWSFSVSRLIFGRFLCFVGLPIAHRQYSNCSKRRTHSRGQLKLRAVIQSVSCCSVGFNLTHGRWERQPDFTVKSRDCPGCEVRECEA